LPTVEEHEQVAGGRYRRGGGGGNSHAPAAQQTRDRQDKRTEKSAHRSENR
jgi:hypothetical protein